MEQFGAVDTTQWEYIKKLINTADYYILVVAGRYGSVDPTDAAGISYTEKEYNYAKATRVPIIAILHENPGELPFDKSEITTEGRERLARFRAEVEDGRLVSYYKDQASLVEAIAAGVVRAKYTHPRPGWVRKSDAESDPSTVAELEQARAEVRELRDRIKEYQVSLKSLQYEISISEEENRSVRDEKSAQSILLSRLDTTTYVHIQYLDDFAEEARGLTINWLNLFMALAKVVSSGSVIMVVVPDEMAKELCAKYAIKGPTNMKDYVTALNKSDFDNILTVFASLELINIPPGSWAPLTLTAKGKKLYLDQKADVILSSKLFE